MSVWTELTGYNRTSLDIKIYIAKEMAKEPPKTEEIEGVFESIKEENWNCEFLDSRKEITEWKKENKDNTKIIFITFAKSGHICCVGAGGDLCFPNISKDSRYKTPKIMGIIKEEMKDREKLEPGKEPWEWDKEKAFGITITNLKGVHKTQLEETDSILKCRDGIEYYIGEALLDNQIPILNAYSHRNYKYEFWEKVKKNEYSMNG